MAQIKKIQFYRTGKNDGCICDRCGQYIQNVWTVTYADGVVARFGIDCFEILCKESKLTAFGKQELKKALKAIKRHQEMYEAEKVLTEETDIAYQNEQVEYSWRDKGYWYGKPWEEYHEWMLTEFFKTRFEEDQKLIDRFSKVNFSR